MNFKGLVSVTVTYATSHAAHVDIVVVSKEQKTALLRSIGELRLLVCLLVVFS